MKSPRTVLLWGVLASCATPTKERPAGSAAAESSSPASAAPLVAPSSAPTSATSAAASAGEAPPQSPTGAAYVGCGEPIPHARLWDETTEGEVLDAISAAKACAAEHGRKLLLEFVAPWCEDCQEMAKLDETPAVAQTLRERFERVRINVGKWDRHEALRKSFAVRALATYVVIDPKTSQELAKTTLEPITKKGQKLSAEQWAKWLGSH
ncbi:MAG TPA: thioredoxin family protein [Polyangiaceae bacterium]|nr:thioredoxin family protein [Polyangiaceae bacterium]